MSRHRAIFNPSNRKFSANWKSSSKTEVLSATAAVYQFLLSFAGERTIGRIALNGHMRSSRNLNEWRFSKHAIGQLKGGFVSKACNNCYVRNVVVSGQAGFRVETQEADIRCPHW
jgi:hypothetical protein